MARLGLPGAFIEDLDHLARCRSLAVVELSKIQYLPLNHAGIMTRRFSTTAHLMARIPRSRTIYGLNGAVTGRVLPCVDSILQVLRK